MKRIPIFLISDSDGEEAQVLLEAYLAPFQHQIAKIHFFPFIRQDEELDLILEQARSLQAMILFASGVAAMSKRILNFARQQHLFAYDLMTSVMVELAHRSQIPLKERLLRPNASKQAYPNRSEAIQFAMQYDDGQNPSGLPLADIVLLGVSQTGKTSLSMYLANKGYKVTNLPILPEESNIPTELYRVEPSRIIGLTNRLDVLLKHRRERMRAYGLDEDTPYSNRERIHEELTFANQLYQALDCLVINVADRSIEETAAIILAHFDPCRLLGE